MLHLLVHQGPMGTVCMQQDPDHVSFWSDYHLHHDSAKHVVKEWNGTLLSSVTRAGTVCMRLMDVWVYGVDVVSVIFRSAFAHDTQVTPQASWCGGHQLQLAVTFGVSAGKVNSAHLHNLITPCYCHFFDRKEICFSAEQRTSTYGCCDSTCSSWCTTTAQASKIPKFLAN